MDPLPAYWCWSKIEGGKARLKAETGHPHTGWFKWLWNCIRVSSVFFLHELETVGLFSSNSIWDLLVNKKAFVDHDETWVSLQACSKYKKCPAFLNIFHEIK